MVNIESLLTDGIKWTKLDISNFDDTARGIIATDQIKKGETLITVPLRQIINLKNIATDLRLDWRALVMSIEIAKIKAQSCLHMLPLLCIC